jgi:hypothetical protein
MREHVLRERIKHALHAAKDARVAGDTHARHEALERAWTDACALNDAVLLATACWRLAKARHDTDPAAGLIDALTPLVSQQVEERGVWGIKHDVGPFDHYEAGLRALPLLTRQHWDHHGYGSDIVDRMWRAYIAKQHEREELYLMSWGQVQLCWQLACSGKLDDLSDIVLAFARLSPERFTQGGHQHPRANDIPSSVYWVQLDLSRALLRGATWAHQERRAWEAMELMEDAAEDVGLNRHQDFWFLDAILRSAGRFGDERTVKRYLEPYAALIDAGNDIADVHLERGKAWIAFLQRKQATTERHASQALDLARHHHAGPEWVVESALLAAVASPPHRAVALRAVARDEAARTAVSMHDLGGNLLA